MARPSLEFLFTSIISALLEFYGVKEPPVPVAEFLRCPPPDLVGDLALVEWAPFDYAFWRRGLAGLGRVYVPPRMRGSERRMALAAALFVGLCSTKNGRAIGLPEMPNDEAAAQKALFARTLLMPTRLLPPHWKWLSADELAARFDVPVEAACLRLQELAAGNFSLD